MMLKKKVALDGKITLWQIILCATPGQSQHTTSVGMSELTAEERAHQTINTHQTPDLCVF